MSKKGDASIVATVLLIVAAIAAAVLVTTFSRQTEEKVGEKIISMGSSVECEDVRVSIEGFETGKVNLTNRGTLGIDKIQFRVYSSTIGIQNFEARDFSSCPENVNGRLLPQKQCSLVLSGVNDPNKIEAIPIIKSEKGELMGCDTKISSWKKNE